MSAGIVPFNYSGRKIRTVLMDGEPWFAAADVCAVLWYAHTASALRALRTRKRVCIRRTPLAVRRT